MEKKIRLKLVILIFVANILLLNSNFVIFFAEGAGGGFENLEGDINANNPPNTPTDPSPEDNSYGVSTTAQLSVYVSDPDGDELDVTFYDASDDSPISVDTVDGNGTSTVEWSGLSDNTRYNWYVIVTDGSKFVDSSTWTFSTASIDYIKITGSSGGDELQDKEVSAGYEKRVYCSAYNQDDGYIGTTWADWSAEGGSSSLYYNYKSNDNFIDVGDIPGDVWLNATHDTMKDNVVFTVKEPTIDYIEIVNQSDKGSTTIDDVSLPIDSHITGYSAGFNNSVGYLEDVKANWTVTNDGTSASTDPLTADHSVLDTGKKPGSLTWKADYDGIIDLVKVDVYDNTPPQLKDLTKYKTPTTGDSFTFSVNVSDNSEINNVFLNYQFDSGTFYNKSMSKGTDSWEHTVTIPRSSESLTYYFTANDLANNWNSTSQTNLDVDDNDPPSVVDTTTGIPDTDTVFNITVDASDNREVQEVILKYTISTIEDKIQKNSTMNPSYWKKIYIPNDATELSYYILAIDETGNSGSTSTKIISVNDTEKPSIVDTTTETPTTGDLFSITAEIEDNIDISDAFLNYSIKSLSGYVETHRVRMHTGYYKDISIWKNATHFSYRISAVDTSNNWEWNSRKELTVIDNDSPTIIDRSKAIGTTGEEYIFNASVSDNILVENVFINYWTDTTILNNVSMEEDINDIYKFTISLPNDSTTLYYNILAVDNSSNWAKTGEISSDIKDDQSPMINITTEEIPTTGDQFNITANISDNIEVKRAWLEFDITSKDGDHYHDNLTLNESTYYLVIEIPSDSIKMNYTVSAVDNSRNWNSSSRYEIEIIDNDPPKISINMNTDAVTGEEYIFNITVRENIDLDQVTAVYWTDVTNKKKLMLNRDHENFYINNIILPINSQKISYNFTAIDSSGNINRTKIYQKDVIDKKPPNIISINVSPDPSYVYLDTNFSCKLSDNIDISNTYLSIIGPDYELRDNYSMNSDSNKNIFYHSQQFISKGNYSYKISSVDSSHNWNTTETKPLDVNPPKIDYIKIRDKSNNEGSVVKNISLEIEEGTRLYAAGYNKTHGYQRDLKVSWASSNNEVMVLDNEYCVSTNCTPAGYGSGKIYGIYKDIQTSVDFEVIEPQDPKIIGEIPEYNLEEDFGIYQLNLSQYASDIQDSKSALKWYITGLNESIITLAGENLTGNHVLNLISQKDKHGDMKVTYWLVDSDGNKVNQTSWINVSSENDPPVFDDFPNLFVRFEEPYPFDYGPYITDSDDPIDDVELTTDDPSHTEVNGFKVIYEYPKEMVNETVYVTLKISDGSESNSRVVRITITADYPPENVKKLPDIVLKENETKKNVFDLDDYIQDPDKDSLYMSYGYTHLDITIHDNHTVDMKAPKFWNGFEKVTFRATDPLGAVKEQTINVTVTPVNSPPKMKKLPPFVVHYDHPYNFDLRWYISDPDNSMNDLDITTSNPSNITVVGTTLRMVYPEKYDSMEYPYTVPLTVSVSDGVNTTSRVTNVTVTDDYPPKVVVPLNDIIFDEDEQVKNAFDLDEHFKDRDSETIYYTAGNENVIVTINDNNTVDFSAPTNWYGSELIKIRATDSRGAIIEDTFKVFVLPVNDPPIIKDIPIQQGEVGEDWVLDLENYISDVDDEMEKLTVSVNTSHIIVAGHKLIFTYPKKPMEEYVQIGVSDGNLENNTEMKVSIVRSDDEKSRSIFDSPYIYTPIPILLLLFGVLYYIMKREYTVDDLFLIHDSGILITHTAREMREERDEDILAGMFTAVQNFVKDAFADDEEESLKRMEYGNKKVLIQKGDNITLAVFFTGDEPKWALESMENFVKDVEERYEGDIEDWSGDRDDLPGVEDMLESMLEKGKYKEGDWKDQK